MAEILYPLSGDFKGPWLIDFQSLQELDNILETAWGRLHDYRDQQIKEEIQKESNRISESNQESDRKWIEERAMRSVEYTPPSRSLTIRFRDGKRLESKSFKEAALERAIVDEIPQSFSVRMRVARVELEIDLTRYSDDALSFNVSPSHTSVSKEIAYDVEKWAKTNRSPLWVRIWRSFGTLIWPFYAVLIVISLAFLRVNSDEYKKDLKAEAHEILKDGISEKEIPRALEIILSLQSDFVPVSYIPTNRSSSTWFWWFLGVVTFVCLLISIPPKTNLGLGKGEKRIRKWKWWIRVISISIPSSVLVPLLLDRIRDVLF